MKRQHFITLILTSFFILTFFHGSQVYAQSSISGDSLCGKWDPVAKKIVNPCGVLSFKQMFQAIFKLILTLGVPAIVVIIIYRFVAAWYAVANGNVGAYKEALKKVTNALIGLIILVAVFSGLTFTMLKYFGAEDWTLKLLKAISMEMVPHAYAAETGPADCLGKPNLTFCTRTGASGILGSAGTCFKNGDVYTCNAASPGDKCFVPSSGAEGNITGGYGTCVAKGAPIPARDTSTITTGPADCIGKPVLTFCRRTGTMIEVVGSAGTCNLNGNAYVCNAASTGDTCFSPTTGHQGTISNINGFCGVVGDPCRMSSGTNGVYSQTYSCVPLPLAQQSQTSSICKLTKAGDTCIGRYDGKPGKILVDDGACIAPGDTCNGNTGPGVYTASYSCLSNPPLQQNAPDVASCTGQPDGTACVYVTWPFNKTGLCGKDASGAPICKKANVNDICINKTTGKPGTIIDSQGFCGGQPVSSPARSPQVANCAGNPNGTACLYNGTSREGLCSDGVVPPPPVSPVAPVVTSSNPVQEQETQLPNPTGFTNFYDFFLSVFAMIMKFFLYPALIGIWVWSGFLYVWAQGAPEKLKQAHNLLFWAVISTLVVFMTNSFLIALQGTVTNILSN